MEAAEIALVKGQQPSDGCHELLDYLATNGYKMGILTRNTKVRVLRGRFAAGKFLPLPLCP